MLSLVSDVSPQISLKKKSLIAVWENLESEEISFLILLAYRRSPAHIEPLVVEPVEEEQDLEDSTLT